MEALNLLSSTFQCLLCVRPRFLYDISHSLLGMLLRVLRKQTGIYSAFSKLLRPCSEPNSFSYALGSYYAQVLEAAQSIAAKVQRSAMKNARNSIKSDSPYATISSKRERKMSVALHPCPTHFPAANLHTNLSVFPFAFFVAL